MRTVYVIHMDNCPHCVSLMSKLDELGLSYTKMNVATKEGRSRAVSSKSKTVPIVYLGDDVSLSLDHCTESQILKRIRDYLQGS